ncbi:alkaline phosphatase family protein [Tunturibacter empetritectus]|uniref:Type I phosphodiesterase/nucleotide pyrophosphatase n=1 Tax=Tunturiibacter lichenicola TaxID=2051959 RepID=A0A7W8N485_9BACT|nr:alkaline phosphatase family protein [Edaphobacter lichenicola]MBB5345302.1 hypothetical protein [Edaphobacter lichenicola]
MKKISIAAATTAVALASFSTNGIGQDPNAIKHVLLLSIDGMHAVDFYNCSNGISGVNGGEPYCPNLANLSHRGTTYTAASTTRPSDSFPGMMTLVTGATPRTMGVYYDVAYDRSLDAPAKTTGNGNLAGPCTAGAAPTGTTTEYEEGIDIDQTKVNGGAPGAGLTDGGLASIDPQKLVRNPAAGCAPVFPWNFIRTNTVFGVIHQAGGYTAWSDKHPAYSSVGGPGGPFLDDFYAPEINSNVIGLPGVKTPEGASCATVRDTAADLTAWTNSFDNIQCYDTLKVNAILNEIAGKTHNGAAAQVPALFGMNFQAVSVGQKLIEANVASGGYTNGEGVPTQELLKEIEYVDASIGQMVTALKDTGNLEDTVIIVTAKHGQSPIDPNLYKATPGKTSNGTTPATLLAAMLPASESPLGGGIGPTEDDVSLLWLKSGADVTAAVSTLEENKAAIGLGQIYYGPSVALNYNKPGLGAGLDPRAPDIIVTPNIGVTYTGSAKKLAEHGGFGHDDTNVMLLVSNPGFAKVSVSVPIATAQVAPTILQLLGLNINLLNAVQHEGTAVLPGIAPAQ